MEADSKKKFSKKLTFLFKYHILIIVLLTGSILIPIFHFSNLEQIFIMSFLNWDIFIDPIGFVIPIITCLIIISTNKIKWSFLVLGMIPICLMAFIITTPVLEKGIVSPFPLWLFPSIMAGWICASNYEKIGERLCYEYAFIYGVFSIIIGADIAHLPTLLTLSTTSSMQATIGGAGILDLIILSGIFSVLFTIIITECLKRIRYRNINRNFYMHM